MHHDVIKFGTDGWRAIIADQYTFENVRRVSDATALWLLGQANGEKTSVVVSHDTRFLGRRFAEAAAEVFASRGIRVILASSFTTTPAVSWATSAFGCTAGVVITASHNPPIYNGFKVKAGFGGPASPQQISEIEDQLSQVDSEKFELKPFERLVQTGQIEVQDIGSAYVDLLRSRIDIEAIRSAGLKIACDPMYGAGQGVLQKLLGEDRTVAIHDEVNPGFGGRAPEPIERNLSELSALVREHECAVGLAFDGDADRIGMFDENGEFVDSHRILSLLLHYLVNDKGCRGDVVKTFSTTDMLDKMCSRYGLNVHVTPIGFKHIATKIMEGDVLLGGEESGGLAVKGHIPERDGIYIGLLVVEMMVRRRRKLSELVQELFAEFGGHFARRTDLHTTEERKREVLAMLESDGLREIGGNTVDRTERIDGHKFRTPAGWLMFRASGTEPVLRIYSEAETPDAAESLIQHGVNIVG